MHPTFAEPLLLCMKSPRADIVEHSSYMYISTTSQLFRTINNLLRSTALHYGLPNTYRYIISNGIPGSTYLGATSAELAPTSEWVTQLPTLACKSDVLPYVFDLYQVQASQPHHSMLVAGSCHPS